LPKLRIEVAVPYAELDGVMEAIADAAKTGKIGDGKIFVILIDRRAHSHQRNRRQRNLNIKGKSGEIFFAGRFWNQ
jgi:nitrogen regulatory protein PII